MERQEQARRLTALRAELARRGLAGVLVPRADEHQGEYVPPHAERLSWLTGFTGSAGLAVVLAERAALFADGRYTIQARQETDPDLYEHRHLVDEPASKWLAEAVRAGAVIGFDPWLHTPDGIGRLREALEAAGASLLPTEGNPVDAVWADQPAPPVAPVVPHPSRFSGRTPADKRAEVAESLRADRLDAAVLTAPESVAWLLDLRGGDVPFTPLPLGYAILYADGGVDLFMDPVKLTGEARAHLGDVRMAAPDALLAALDRLAGKAVRLDRGSAAWAIAERLKAAGAVVKFGDDPCALPRACKNAVELDGMRAAHARDGVALVRFLAWLDGQGAGLSEIQAADRLEAFRAEGEHFMGLSFPTIAGAGEHGAIVHYRVTPETDRLLADGELFLLDSGAQYLDGTTDVTRTIAIGTPSQEMRRRYTQVLKGHLALARVVFPDGTTGSQLDVLARQFLWADGVDFDHGTGHGVGSYLSVHEGPQRVSKVGNTVALKPGMVLSNEPGYYKTGAFGIRIETLQAVVRVAAPPAGAEKTLLGFETLTLAPLDRRLIAVDLLTAQERAEVDAYHARVRAVIGPRLQTADRVWLEAATAPL